MRTINVESHTVALDGCESETDFVPITAESLSLYVGVLVSQWLADGEGTELRLCMAVNRTDL